MKKLKSELRMWFAEKLLGWAFDVTPWNEEGHKLRKHIANYSMEKVIEFERGNEI
jgi:hypothetical protein